jgi:hypothetical protein
VGFRRTNLSAAASPAIVNPALERRTGDDTAFRVTEVLLDLAPTAISIIVLANPLISIRRRVTKVPSSSGKCLVTDL